MSRSPLTAGSEAPIDIHGLLQSQGGLFESATRFRTPGLEPRFTTRVVRLGALGALAASGAKPHAPHHEARVMGGGTGLDDADALHLALAEGLERYSTCLYGKDQLVRASADELGAEALDLDTIPRCSASELAHPLCPLVAPDKHAPIRWVRGVSLLDGHLVYVPAVMVYLRAGFTAPAERIALPISTGCATHTSYERALAHALMEVVERDAISVTWLQQLRLPRIVVDSVPAVLAPYWDRYQRSSSDLEYVFFDATTDVGIPTVYGVQIARAHKRLTTLVTCATDMTPERALAKVIRDMAPGRLAMRDASPPPASWDEFHDVMHGATYMARAERADAFGFLLQSESRRPLSAMTALEPASEGAELSAVLERLRRLELEAYAVDLSTDEALRFGLRVVRVVVPGLQPLSFHYRGRYLGHPRLYQAPARMGFPVRTEEELNQWPQPFA